MKTTYEALSEQERWIPVDDLKRPMGKWADESHWRTRDQIDGRAGYVITGNRDITIIDFDKCLEGDEIVDNPEGPYTAAAVEAYWECFRTVRPIDLFHDVAYMSSFLALSQAM